MILSLSGCCLAVMTIVACTSYRRVVNLNRVPVIDCMTTFTPIRSRNMVFPLADRYLPIVTTATCAHQSIVVDLYRVPVIDRMTSITII